MHLTRWTLEVVDAGGISTVWDGEFDIDEDALSEFERPVRESELRISPDRIHAGQLLDNQKRSVELSATNVTARQHASAPLMGDDWPHVQPLPRDGRAGSDPPAHPNPRGARSENNRPSKRYREDTSLLMGLASTVKVIAAAFASLPARLIGDLQV